MIYQKPLKNDVPCVVHEQNTSVVLLCKLFNIVKISSWFTSHTVYIDWKPSHWKLIGPNPLLLVCLCSWLCTFFFSPQSIYWPESGSVNQSGFIISCNNTTIKTHYTIRQLDVRKENEEVSFDFSIFKLSANRQFKLNMWEIEIFTEHGVHLYVNKRMNIVLWGTVAVLCSLFSTLREIFLLANSFCC